MLPTEVVTLHGFAHGGEAVGRLPDGRAVFVGHAIPGETVRIQLTESRKTWARGQLEEVLEASTQRVTPPCPYFGPGRCGGCRLQHIDRSRHADLLRQVVVDALQRIGRIPEPPVTATVAAGDYGYRNRARFAVTETGALGYRRHASHDIIPIDRCLLLDEPTQALREAAGDAWTRTSEVEVRTAAVGETVVAIGKKTTVAHGGVLTHCVGGFEFRVSERSFFQSNTQGASLLLRLVREEAAAMPGDTALDLYAGVGLFARGLLADGASVVAVEGSASSAADARHNLAEFADRASVIHAPVEQAVRRLAPRGRHDIVVADPPRSGAGRPIVEAITGLAERVIVIVACDPAALARDTATLAAHGWHLTQAVPVDQFAQTAHVEVVATFRRAAPGGDAATYP